jgi:signal transduction histidine kinase
MTAVADTILLIQLAHDSYQIGTFLDAFWPLATLLVALGALVGSGGEDQAGSAGASPTRWEVLPPVLLAGLAVALLTWDHFHQINTPALVLVVATLGVLVARHAVSMREGLLARRRLERLVTDQAALGRVARAVAANQAPAEVFDLAAREAASLLGAGYGAVVRFADDQAHVVSFRDVDGPLDALSLPISGAGALAQVARSGNSARVDGYVALAGDPTAGVARSFGWTNSAAAPVRAGGTLWGAVAVASSDGMRLPVETEETLAQFAELVGMAIAGARTRDELRVSGEQLRRQAAIVQAVRDAAPEAISMVDLEGRTLIANPAAERLLSELAGAWIDGTPPEGLAALAHLTIDPDGMRAALRALATDPERTGEQEYELADSGRIFRTYSAPVRAGDGRSAILGRLFVTSEVTDERRLARAKDEFTQLASHELRMPLTSIMGYLEIVLDGEAGELRPQQRRFLEVVERNTNRLLSLVADLLVVARADAGRLGLELCALDLGELAAECAESAQPVARERRIALEVEVEPLRLSGDRGRLGEVIDNLVSNALKFTPPGGRVRVSAHIEDGRAVLEVADSGMGISAADQEHLFERFYRTQAALQAAIPGSGLGLAISRMIAEAHGGTIGVESREGRGATFRMQLPLAAGPGALEQPAPALLLAA